MQMTFRWFGKEKDTVSLEQIRQIPGVKGVITTLYDIPAGEEWPMERILQMKEQVEAKGLKVMGIESVNIHDAIKVGTPDREKYIANYITTLERLGQADIHVVCYNFMPVFDWLRTDLARVIEEDGSNSLYFDEKELGNMTPLDIVKKTAEDSHGFTLPGWEPERLAELEKTLKQYEGITPDMLRENYKYFLDAIIPVCEEVGVKMAVHPDDPAWPIFGLPRISHSQEDFDKIVALHDSPANALCLCTGSLGSNPANDIPAIIRHFGEMDRIACLHIRNVKYLGERCFREAAHLSSTGDLDMFEIVKAVYDTCPHDVYVRPDHGRMIWGEVGRPGYGLYDRALGATYLNGLWEAIDKMSNK